MNVIKVINFMRNTLKLFKLTMCKFLSIIYNQYAHVCTLRSYFYIYIQNAQCKKQLHKQL